MSDDEAAIRTLVADWLAATRRGDVATVLDLVTDDVVFLNAGGPPMEGRAAFAAAMAAFAGPGAPQVDATSVIRELVVAGDWAWLWSDLDVRVTPPGGTPVLRRGPALTLLRKAGGRWRIARDANMVGPEPSP
ncbi:MAG: SgcJ/EcaC family oxidoreductase [Burkholderiales bacterium]